MAVEEADRAALISVGRWPQTGPAPGSLFWSPDVNYPKEWTFTGFDLAMFRGRLNVSQKVLAGQLGVEGVEVARAEAKPRDKVRPALQVALLRAFAEYRNAGSRRQQEAPAVATSGPPRADAARVVYAGADLARFRAEQGLSQRQAAEMLGVAHGTVAKAELAPDKRLGEQLHRALGLVVRR